MAEYAGKRLVHKRIEAAAKRAEARAARPKKKSTAQLIREWRIAHVFNRTPPAPEIKRRKRPVTNLKPECH